MGPWVLITGTWYNCFRSEWGANLYANVRSVIETARRRGIGTLRAISFILDGIALSVAL